MTDPGPTIVSRPAAPDSASPTADVAPSPARQITGSFDDPAVYQSYVRALFDGIAPRIPTANREVTAEIANFARLLSLMPPDVVQRHRDFIELAFEILQSGQPNLVVLRGIRRDLYEVNERHMGGVTRILVFLSGRTLLNAVLSALTTIFVMSFVFMAAMHAGVRLMAMIAGQMNGGMGTLAAAPESSFRIAMLMAHAAFLGSIVSIMARINTFLSDAALTPSTMYLSVVTRPVVSVLVAMLVFCSIKSGLVSFQAVNLSGPGGFYTAWAIGFLCGFSERLAQNFVATASQQFTGAPAAISSQTTK